MESEKKRFGWVIVGAVVLGAAGFAMLGSFGEPPTPPAQTPEPAKVASKPVEPAPEVEEVPAAEEPSDDMKAALLGEKKEPEPAPRKYVRRPARRVVQDESDDLYAEPQQAATLSEEAFYSALDNWGGLKACLKSSPAEGDRTGALQVAFKIGKDGDVLESKVFNPTTEQARAIAPCVERRAKHVRFPKFVSGESVIKEAKFVF